jgi:hypothetical protein
VEQGLDPEVAAALENELKLALEEACLEYRKYALAPVDDGESAPGEASGGELQEEVEDDNVEVISVGDGSEVEAPQELKLKERLNNAVELDVLAEDFDWGNLLSVHRTEHAQSEEDERSDGRDSIGSVEVCILYGICICTFALHMPSSHHTQA